MFYEKSVLHPQVHKVLDLSVTSFISTFRDHGWVPYCIPQVIFLSANMPVNQILVSLLWFCPFGRRHSSSLQSNFVVPKGMFSFLGLHGPPYAKVPIKWGPRSGTYHTNLEWYFLVNASCFTARWCLKSKNCTGWWLSSIAFQSYSVSHFTVADCALAFLPWKEKSPHFSQYWKAFLQHVNRPIHREVDPLDFGSTMLFSAIRCILKTAWNINFQIGETSNA